MFAARPPQGIPDDDAQLGHAGALPGAARRRAATRSTKCQRLRTARPAVRAQPQLLALRRLPRHRRRRARQAHAGRASRRSCGAGRSSIRPTYLAKAGTPGAIGGDERIDADAPPVRLHAQRAAPGRWLRAGRLRSAHRPAARGDRARNLTQRTRRGLADDRRRRPRAPDRARPALHQRRDRAVPAGLTSGRARPPASAAIRLRMRGRRAGRRAGGRD